MSEDTGPVRPQGEIVLYQSQHGDEPVRVLLEGETVWLPQAMIAELFQTSVANINIHLKNIYEEGELDETATIKEYLIVRQEGSRKVSRKVLHYSLDAILAVGYRVKSPVATAFRQWATARLKEYLVKGFTLNDERLKGTDSVTDHFDELLARIREIRASEARVYQRIRETFALAVDYREGEKAARMGQAKEEAGNDESALQLTIHSSLFISSPLNLPCPFTGSATQRRFRPIHRRSPPPAARPHRARHGQASEPVRRKGRMRNGGG